jgi:hypothetical protein
MLLHDFLNFLPLAARALSSFTLLPGKFPRRWRVLP